jgi:hypothetical protein
MIVIGELLVVVDATSQEQLLLDRLNVDSRVQPEAKRLRRCEVKE